MKLTALIVLLLFVFQETYGQDKNLRSFGKEVHELSDVLQLPGFTLAVVKNGKIVYRQMEGYSNLEKKTPVREDDLFMIASVTKTFTANLMMQYEQEHKASLDDPILKYRHISLKSNSEWPHTIDTNTKVRHFMSHTSEDGPGSSFVYNGSRFNFVYGVFESVGGYTPSQDAFTLELQKRILVPLGMKQTISGFPSNRSDALFRHIATPYIYDTENKRFAEDTVNYARWTRAFPSGGLLSTISDLVKYTNSYDEHRLITAESYAKVTRPTVLNDQSLSPYGIGWFTENLGGKKIHWHYGQADSYAALFIRVPETGYTFIFLSNSNAPSDALRLGPGGIAHSPFAAAFLKRFVFVKDAQMQEKLGIEESIGWAMFLRYSENKTGAHKGYAESIIRELFKSNPERFDAYDPGLIYLLTDLHLPDLNPLIDKQANAYRANGHIQPSVVNDLAQYYVSVRRYNEALEFCRKLAEAKGFGSR